MPTKVVPWEIIGDRLHDLAKQGLANHEIAMVLSREFNAPVTRNAVIGKLRRTNIAKRKAGTVHQLHEIKLAQSKPAKPVSIMQLEPHHCRWPIDTANGVCYCGKQKIAGSYCQEHSRRAYHHGKAEKQDRKDHARVQAWHPAQRLEKGT